MTVKVNTRQGVRKASRMTPNAKVLKLIFLTYIKLMDANHT